MKTKLSAIAILLGCLLVGIATRAQETPPVSVTNNLTVVIPSTVDDTLRNAWRIDNHARTNALFPYVQAESAQTYREFRESIAKQAFEAAAVRARQNNEEFIRNHFPRADDDTQMRIVRILTGKE